MTDDKSNCLKILSHISKYHFTLIGFDHCIILNR